MLITTEQRVTETPDGKKLIEEIVINESDLRSAAHRWEVEARRRHAEEEHSHTIGKREYFATREEAQKVTLDDVLREEAKSGEKMKLCFDCAHFKNKGCRYWESPQHKRKQPSYYYCIYWKARSE